ncbi:MAG TPA: VOC family protein [Candidatus Paceibacterota bacterium]|nr:VOC family protein [Candidatus Paceibacterota bacterium]
MFKDTHAFSGFAVKDLAAAKKFYSEVLEVPVEDRGAMGITLKLAGGNTVFVYPKADHVPATYTILNFLTHDIDVSVDEMTAKGIVFEKYPSMTYQDEKGVARGIKANMGPDIAWFKDPSGNILSVLQDK